MWRMRRPPAHLLGGGGEGAKIVWCLFEIAAPWCSVPESCAVGCVAGLGSPVASASTAPKTKNAIAGRQPARVAISRRGYLFSRRLANFSLCLRGYRTGKIELFSVQQARRCCRDASTTYHMMTRTRRMMISFMMMKKSSMRRPLFPMLAMPRPKAMEKMTRPFF